MARITVEDCVDKIPSRFELVMCASQRARKIGAGAALLVERDNDKNPVVALREIAEEKIIYENMEEELIRRYQRVVTTDDDDESMIEMMDGEEEWGGAKDSEESDKAPSLQDLAGIKD